MTSDFCAITTGHTLLHGVTTTVLGSDTTHTGLTHSKLDSDICSPVQEVCVLSSHAKQDFGETRAPHTRRQMD